MIYLDNGATTLQKPPQVAQAVAFAIDNFGNPSRGAYPASVNALRTIFSVREAVSKLFNVPDSSRVAFTSNITEALNICANILAREGETIITTVFAHNSVIRPLYKSKANIKILQLTDKWTIDYNEMEKHLQQGAKAVFCSHASNLTGDILDISQIGALCRRYNAFFVLDTAQTAGFFDIDMQKDNIDYICFTGHKSLYGPQGTGGICVSERAAVMPLKVGGSGINSFALSHPDKMPEALEAGTPNTPGIHGLLAGIDFINQVGMDNIREHEEKLMRKLYEGIKNLNRIKIYGNFSDRIQRAPIVTFNIADIDAGVIAEELWNRAEICVRAGAHCAPNYHKFLKTEAQGAVRLSLSYYNTEKEIDTVIETVHNICKII